MPEKTRISLYILIILLFPFERKKMSGVVNRQKQIDRNSIKRRRVNICILMQYTESIIIEKMLIISVRVNLT
jgi:hypothetical protein